MKRRVIILLTIFFVLLVYFFVFSLRSPFRDVIFPVVFSNIANGIQPHVEPDPNTYNIVFKKGTNIHAELLREDGDSIVVRRHQKDGAYSDETYAKRAILNMDVRPQVFPVTASEILAKRLFPEMSFYRRENVTIFTDSGYGQVAPVVGVIDNLQDKLKKRFGALFDDNQDSRVCVVIFQKEGGYHDFVLKNAGAGFGQTAGFYSHDLKLLFVDNSSSLRRRVNYPNDTIRHEAAHQMFYQSGLHFGFNIDRPWLVEGLAVYCESIRIGEEHRARLENVKKVLMEGRAMPLTQMLRTLTISEKKMLDFYDQAWAFVYFLMSRYENDFLVYLFHIQKHPIQSFLKGDAALLTEYLHRPISDLEREFRAFVKKL